MHECQALITRHLIVDAYLWTQSLLPPTKMHLKEVRRPLMESSLGYAGYLRIISFSLEPK